MKKIIAFDLDDTLAPSKSPAPDRIVELLDTLLDKFTVCVISGGKFGQFEKQLLNKLKLNGNKLTKLHILPTCGTQYFIYNPHKSSWTKVYSEDLTVDQKKTITAALNKGLDDLGFRERKTYGEVIEDRGSQMTMSTLGQDIVDMLGEEGVRLKAEWDPDRKKKEKLQAYISKLIPEFEVKVGGGTSIDITKPGIDKAYGMKKLMEATGTTKSDILFIGDRLQPGGNDYPVIEFGIDGIQISHWKETAVAIEAIIHAS